MFPEEAKEKIKFVPVETVDQVLEMALEKSPPKQKPRLTERPSRVADGRSTGALQRPRAARSAQGWVRCLGSNRAHH